MKIKLLPVLLLIAATSAFAQQAANRPSMVAGFPVNYSEDSVGTYTLPELLKTSDGKPVTTAKQWTEKRRPELLRLAEENQFGKMPPRPKDLSFHAFDKGGLLWRYRT